MIDRFYLIVGSVALLEQLVPLGVKTVQLRIKDQPIEALRTDVIRARDLCASFGATLILNDHWEMALDLGVDFVHLGQEDMEGADLVALRRAGVRFGLSTHDEGELDRALAHAPAYVALGPVYPTLLKKMKWAPQGLDRVSEWKRRTGDTPLVAIGGLTPDRLPAVFSAGADSVAVVTDIQQAENPVQRCQQWLATTRVGSA